MPSADRITEPSWTFPDGNGITYFDLAYEQYVARDADGACTAHVEGWFSMLARRETAQRNQELLPAAACRWGDLEHRTVALDVAASLPGAVRTWVHHLVRVGCTHERCGCRPAATSVPERIVGALHDFLADRGDQIALRDLLVVLEREEIPATHWTSLHGLTVRLIDRTVRW